MNIRQPLCAALLAAGLLSACSDGTSPDDAPPLAGAPIGGPFTLEDAAGATIGFDDLKGKWSLIYFGYTYCPDVCPVDVQRMGRAYGELEQGNPALAAQLRPIFISVDPKRDTPQIAQDFAASFHPGMIGLSGTEEQVQGAVDAFRAYRAIGEARADGFYLVDHSAHILLLDADGKPVNFYDRDISPADMAADIRHWMSS